MGVNNHSFKILCKYQNGGNTLILIFYESQRALYLIWGIYIKGWARGNFIQNEIESIKGGAKLLSTCNIFMKSHYIGLKTLLCNLSARDCTLGTDKKKEGGLILFSAGSLSQGTEKPY
ncbi:hypothetical protein SAMN05421766_10956 [Zobellia uliginosa]|uniref:Uncharacterized protein n=1 Tax=Zobellia uliginosa TaxID=143224 RepID=A0ABY1L1U9_9FLAO|nr:hypothetical protein SAMN05421766_10956 [Zobellia uliginosa]